MNMNPNPQPKGFSLIEAVLTGPYAQLAAVAAVYEIRLRMLADMRKSTSHATHAHKASEAESEIVKEYKLGSEEAKRLETTRQLRNKVLHGAFRDAKEKLADLGIVVPPGNVHQVTLSGDVSKFEEDVANAKPVSATDGTNQIAGWLLECQGSGFFPLAVATFLESMKVLDRLRDIASDDEP